MKTTAGYLAQILCLSAYILLVCENITAEDKVLYVPITLSYHGGGFQVKHNMEMPGRDGQFPTARNIEGEVYILYVQTDGEPYVYRFKA